jgi:hypothetical protein
MCSSGVEATDGISFFGGDVLELSFIAGTGTG